MVHITGALAGPNAEQFGIVKRERNRASGFSGCKPKFSDRLRPQPHRRANPWTVGLERPFRANTAASAMTADNKQMYL
jgi:hypothetical protein